MKVEYYAWNSASQLWLQMENSGGKEGALKMAGSGYVLLPLACDTFSPDRSPIKGSSPPPAPSPHLVLHTVYTALDLIRGRESFVFFSFCLSFLRPDLTWLYDRAKTSPVVPCNPVLGSSVVAWSNAPGVVSSVLSFFHTRITCLALSHFAASCLTPIEVFNSIPMNFKSVFLAVYGFIPFKRIDCLVRFQDFALTLLLTFGLSLIISNLVYR